MDIHPPHGPIRSLKEFLVQLITITVGVLIALSLEGVREWSHYRTLVREAKATLAREIADNKKEADGELAALSQRQQDYDNAIRLASQLLETKKTDVHQIKLNYSMGDLTAASWQTAERTGALAHMEYADVQRYAKLYEIQSLYVERQRMTLGRVGSATQILTGDPTQAAPKDLETFRQRVLELRGDLIIEEALLRRLSEDYAKALRE